MRVTDSVYVLSGSYYGAVDNRDTLGDVYGIRTAKGLILIDCGIPGGGYDTVKETLAYYGLLDVPVTHLLITHAHYDHCGSARAVQDTGALVAVGAEDVFQCENGGSVGLDTPFKFTHVYPAFRPDIVIDKDCEMTLDGINFKFYKTPGHTPGSVCIAVELDGKKILFTGDSVQPSGKQLCEVGLGWQGDVAFSRENIVKSMLKLMDMDVDVVLPGHGKVCLRNGTEVLRLAAETAFLTMR